MKRLVLTTLCVAALSATTGCATSVYRVSETQNAVLPPQPRKPIVAVQATPSADEAKSLSEGLKLSLDNELTRKGFDVKSERKSDAIVDVSVTRREKSKLGEWYLYEGTGDVRVKTALDGRLVGSKSFTAVGQRVLDEKKAITSVGSGLSGQITEWLSKTLVAGKVPQLPPTSTHAVALLTIAPEDVLEDPAEVLRVQRQFMDAVASRPGIVFCRLEQEIPASRSFVFRVEYEVESFPGGLLNTIVLENPSLGGARLTVAR